MKLTKLVAWMATSAGVAVAAATGVTGPAAAAPKRVDVAVEAGPAVLDPAPDGGYVGNMDIKVRYAGQGRSDLDIYVTLPEGLYIQESSEDGSFYDSASGWTTPYNIWWESIANGETKNIRLRLRALAMPTAQTRRTSAGTITATVAQGSGAIESTPADNTAEFVGELRGTGSGIDALPYRPATTYDLNAVAGPVTVGPDHRDDQGYLVEFPLTLRSTTDGHQSNVEVTLVTDRPQQIGINVVPASACVSAGDVSGWSCYMEMLPIPENADRTIQVLIDMDELPAAGTEFAVRAVLLSDSQSVVDENPIDNTVIVRL